MINIYNTHALKVAAHWIGLDWIGIEFPKSELKRILSTHKCRNKSELRKPDTI